MNRQAILYAIPTSHPCHTAEKALQLKHVPYRRVDLSPIYHRIPQRLRFGRPTVPGLRLADGEKIVGSPQILRRLEEVAPEPPLFPADRRSEVEEAERWGDEVFQAAARRIAVLALSHSTAEVIVPTATGSRVLGVRVPDFWIRLNARPGALFSAWMYGAGEETVRQDIAALPGSLDRIDAWIADGTLGGQSPNAADLQIGSSLRVLTSLADLEGLLAGRPADRLARRLFPRWPVRVPAGPLVHFLSR